MSKEESERDKMTNEETKMFHYADGPSLEEINGTVAVPKKGGFWRTLFAFSGPGALVAVGYMDPGNWVTSIAGGAQYQYTLLSVILISSLIAMLLQAMSARLGIASGLDLAQATAKHSPTWLRYTLWIITELAIMATDIAEIVGAAIALKLLFNLPLIVGIFLTTLDVMLLLLLMKLGFRKIEAIVGALIVSILVIFLYEVILARPDVGAMFAGYIPQPEVVTNKGAFYIALGIVGATVMPHNLYLHSSIAQARQYDRNNIEEKRRAIKFTVLDSNIQLSVAFVVNTLLLLLGAALFYGAQTDLGTFSELYNALQNPQVAGVIASPILSVLFAVALLASGQNSTITGTLSGQIVMEGFIHLKMPMWARRVITRLISVIPVLIFAIIYHSNEAKIEDLLVFSQVFLSIALPVSIIPLVMFTANKKIMGPFVNKKWVTITSSLVAIILTGLNIFLILQTLGWVQ
ncbi:MULTISPECIES: Nramp family divalent metal transporter [Holzapfeliella]